MTYEKLFNTIEKYNKLEHALGSGCRLKMITTPLGNGEVHISIVQANYSLSAWFHFTDSRTIVTARGVGLKGAAKDLTKEESWIQLETYYEDRITAMRGQLESVREILEASGTSSESSEAAE